MPKRTDIDTILLIGSGPIVIGQACEFDYSGSQAAQALMDEGYRVVLVNSNPATIMTDPMMADEVYLQPLTVESITRIVEKEQPDAVLPTMGGQTALNLTEDVQKAGVWAEHGVELIGVDLDAVQRTEDRQRFRDLMEEVGLDQGRSQTAKTVDEAAAVTRDLGGLPVVIRPSYTLGGSGGGIVRTEDEFERMVSRGLEMSPVHQVLIEECLFGWKEYELELLRDANENVVIICSIENVNPMGVHTGDSVTVAPQQTLTDRQYQAMRDAAIKAMRSIGTFAGGCNIQFAVDPETGRMIVIEINPRVSRSSALASKATGYPIAKVATRLAVGYTLDELPNEITGTSACFEPSIDYVVTKIPRFNFDKFEGVDEALTTQMKAVGEVLALGRTFPESLQKAWQSLEIGYHGLGADRPIPDRDTVRERLEQPYWDQLLHVRHALYHDASVEEIHDVTKIDRWFLRAIGSIVDMERQIATHTLDTLPNDLLREAKRYGFSDTQLAFLLAGDLDDDTVRAHRKKADITPSFLVVDTCAGEFPADTPYYYSSYDAGNERPSSDRDKVLILGSGPNRIGQGIEFDYACVHGVRAAQQMGYEALMLNCNPETVSTDFNVADGLFVEPVYWEHIMNVIDHEQPAGVIVQLGGQTALKYAERFAEHGIRVLGTDPASMDRAEDRGHFSTLLQELNIPSPPYGMAQTVDNAVQRASDIGYPVLIRPSYVLGGQDMRIAHTPAEVQQHVARILQRTPDNAILLDRFLEGGIEVDVDAICDGTDVWISGILEHVEPAGVHSGDSTAVLPPHSLPTDVQDTIRDYVEQLARALNVRGLLNVQLVVHSDTVYVIEANPRASRTVPFVAKATGAPVAAIATRVMLGDTLANLRNEGLLDSHLTGYALKRPVFSWDKFPEVRQEVGPEMRSTGEAIVFTDEMQDEHLAQPYPMRAVGVGAV